MENLVLSLVGKYNIKLCDQQSIKHTIGHNLTSQSEMRDSDPACKYKKPEMHGFCTIYHLSLHGVFLSSHSEVSFLGEGIKPLSDWSCRKNMSTKMVNFTIYGGVFCISPLQMDTVDTDTMAAIEIGTKREKMGLFPKFMADLQL